MTVRQSLVAKLLVSLEDEQSVESSSVEEIEANLRALGSDPAASIAFAERLASAARSPVARRRMLSDGSVTPEDGVLTSRHEPGELTSRHEPAEAVSSHLLRAAAKVDQGRGQVKWRARAFGLVRLGTSQTGPDWRRRVAVAACLPLLFVAVATAYVSQLPPAFEAESLVMLNDRQAQVAPDIPEVLAGIPPNEQGLQGQLLLIQSRSMAERMVDQLNLHLLPEFNPALRVGSSDLSAWLDPARLIPAAILDRLPRTWADTLMTTTSGAEMTDQQRAALLRSEIVDNVLGSIVAEPANGSTVIALRFISTDPQLAALGANALARLYLAEQLETKQTASRRAREFLEIEIERLGGAASAERVIEDYWRQAGLGAPRPTSSSSPA